MKGGFGCSPCCDPCPPCEQECVEPHTGDPFEVVYTRFFEGVEAGNPTDGYLTATGDSDTDDPYDGMDGSAPWYQQVSGSFSFGPGVTRHPCSINISFWRNSYALGPATIPPAGSTLTYEKIKVTCNTGKIIVGNTILEAGQEYESPQEIPVVAGTGDQSGSDPVTYYGTINVRPVCREASFSVQARIQWETQKRQHVLYGKVRECYDIDGVTTSCNQELYLTISNYRNGSASNPNVNGTYVVPILSFSCNVYQTVGEQNDLNCYEAAGDFALGRTILINVAPVAEGQDGETLLAVFMPCNTSAGCKMMEAQFTDNSDWNLATGSGLIASGTASFKPLGGGAIDGEFDWEITA